MLPCVLTATLQLRAEKQFGQRGIDPSVVDEMIEKEERRIMKRRVLCDSCYTYKSTSGVCFC